MIELVDYPTKEKYGYEVKGFYLETWKWNIRLVWPIRGPALNALIRMQYVSTHLDDADDYLGRAYDIKMSDYNVTLIALRHWKVDGLHLSALMHECFHATEFIMKAREVPHGEDTSEVFAYTQDVIFRKSLGLLGMPTLAPLKFTVPVRTCVSKL